MNQKWIALVLLALGANFACAASFDCDKAGTKVEKMICADPALSKLDEELGKAYTEALESSSEPKTLKVNQRNWLAVRNGCLDTDCLASSYRSQIGELTGEPKKGKLLMLLSNNDKLCGEYKDYIEHEVATKRQYGHMTVPMCSRPFGKEYPAFEAVQWREVSPEDYPELAVQAYRYIRYWPWDRGEVASYLKESSYQGQLDSIKSKHSYRWWHMWLGEADVDNSGDKEVLLRVEADGRCGEAMDKPPRWVMPVMVVDASGKDIDVKKSDGLQKVTVPFPITTYHWPPKTYWTPNIKPIPGLYIFGLSAFDSFTYAEERYFDVWHDEWEQANKGLAEPLYSSLSVYQISNSETYPVCRFKFKK